MCQCLIIMVDTRPPFYVYKYDRIHINDIMIALPNTSCPSFTMLFIYYRLFSRIRHLSLYTYSLICLICHVPHQINDAQPTDRFRPPSPITILYKRSPDLISTQEFHQETDTVSILFVSCYYYC